jgi:hypothetical protein
MKSDELLNRLREIARTEYVTRIDELEAFDQMTETFLELDRWIMSGGAIPTEWSIHTHPSTAPLGLMGDDP